MAKNDLRQISGKKIRRQYFNIPLVVLFCVMIAVPYAIFIFSHALEKSEQYGTPSTLWTSIFVCAIFSLLFLILRSLCKNLFGRILCVLTDDGIHYPTGMVRWETIDRIDYCMDGFKANIYTKGGKHIAIQKAPLCLIRRIKKLYKKINVTISGIKGLFSLVMIFAVIFILCPLYILLLVKSRGILMPKFIAWCVIWVVFGIVRIPVFDKYAVEYRFWRRILPNKPLSYAVLGFYYSSFFLALLLLFYFPNWIVVFLLGVYIGVVQPPFPSKYGSSRFRSIMSYDRLCETYITNAEIWENKLKKKP